MKVGFTEGDTCELLGTAFFTSVAGSYARPPQSFPYIHSHVFTFIKEGACVTHAILWFCSVFRNTSLRQWFSLSCIRVPERGFGILCGVWSILYASASLPCLL